MTTIKEKLCKCGGKNPDCPICEGTGVILFDEKFDDAQCLNEDEEYYDDKFED